MQRKKGKEKFVLTVLMILTGQYRQDQSRLSTGHGIDVLV